MNNAHLYARMMVYKDAIDFYGDDMQLTVALEEMTELSKEICKYKRADGDRGHIAEEIADVMICLEQMQMIFDVNSQVQDWMRKKVERLRERIAEHREEPKVMKQTHE